MLTSVIIRGYAAARLLVVNGALVAGQLESCSEQASLRLGNQNLMYLDFPCFQLGALALWFQLWNRVIMKKIH